MAQPRKDFERRSAATIFVDRQEPKQTFVDAAASIPTQGCIIRTWYGVGGQGKTALARELFRMATRSEDRRFAHLRCAMLDLHNRSLTDPDLLLIWIRNAMSRAGIAFPAFDLAFAIMWEQTRGAENLPVIENSWLSRSGELVSENANDFVTLTREFLSEQASTIPVLGFLIKKGSIWAIDKAKKSWIKRAHTHVNVLYRDGKLIEPHEMSEAMPWILAQDLNAHLVAHPEDRFVLFVDEYERVHEGAGTGAKWRDNRLDNCLRSLITETNGLLTLFFSRERLPWGDDPQWRKDLEGNQHLLGGLSDSDAEDWLLRVPVSDIAIRRAMVAGARETSSPEAPVYPLMLDLQVEHWRNLGNAALVPLSLVRTPALSTSSTIIIGFAVRLASTVSTGIPGHVPDQPFSRPEILNPALPPPTSIRRTGKAASSPRRRA
ncbi:hypothetical protein [Rhodobacter capsulatus]|uniref:hypothetical protein n=1 Tax=Rhodobacter capsulatus TaxID=1061 RepID=UPI0040250057